jgi:hypothetical protein
MTLYWCTHNYSISCSPSSLQCMIWNSTIQSWYKKPSKVHHINPPWIPFVISFHISVLWVPILQSYAQKAKCSYCSGVS